MSQSFLWKYHSLEAWPPAGRLSDARVKDAEVDQGIGGHKEVAEQAADHVEVADEDADERDGKDKDVTAEDCDFLNALRPPPSWWTNAWARS